MQNNTATGGEIIDIKDRGVVAIKPESMRCMVIDNRELFICILIREM
jgi:hypothetical protein